ncbi:MAG: type IV secretory system conjugative DNA transfer family protein [Cellulomonadaceae bacterium]
MSARVAGAGNDQGLNLAIGAVVAVVVLAGLLRAAGNVAAWVSRTEQPTGRLGAGLGVLANPHDPATVLGSPGLSPLVYWAVLALLLTILTTAGWCAWRLIDRTHTPRRDVHRLDGTATARDVATFASRKALLARSGTLRPALTKPKPTDVGYQLGTAHRRSVWSSVEDSTLVLGPPRSGKGLHVVINAILDAPGAVITTSTRPDNLTATLRARERAGPVAVFDPQHLAASLPRGLRWSPIRGCTDPLTAMIRAGGLASATGLSKGGVEAGGFWEGKTRTVIQSLLHAAALGHANPAQLFSWSQTPSAAADAVAILTSDTHAAKGWAESLETTIRSDARTRDSVWAGVSQALQCLADPRVLDAVTPAPGEEFDPAAFLRGNGTLYLLATGAGSSASWPLVAAFIEDLVETARHLAAASPGARLDPPLLLALDEIGNLTPLPSLPVLMAEGGGTGITTMAILQSLAQARDKWGDHAAGAIWDASITKVVLGGSSAAQDLKDLSALIGERDEYTNTITTGEHGSRSHQRAVRRVPIMPPELVRTLPFGTGLVLLRSAPPILTTLRPWHARPDAAQITTDRTSVESALRRS